MKTESSNDGGNILIFAIRKSAGFVGEIYFVKDLQNFNPKLIAKRGEWIWALCAHNGKLYDAGDYGRIYETLSGKCVDNENGRVTALGSHEGRLYKGVTGEQTDIIKHKWVKFWDKDIVLRKSVYSIVSDGKLIETRKHSIRGLHSYKGNLYDFVEIDNRVYDTLKKQVIIGRDRQWEMYDDFPPIFVGNMVGGLCTHEGEMYDLLTPADGKKYGSSKIYKTFANPDRIVGEEKGIELEFLCSHNGMLIAADRNTFYQFDPKKATGPLQTPPSSIYKIKLYEGGEIKAMVSVPEAILTH